MDTPELEANTKYTTLEILEFIQPEYTIGDKTLKVNEVIGKYVVRIAGVVCSKPDHLVRLSEGMAIVIVGPNRFEVTVGPDQGKTYKSEAAKPVIKAQGQVANQNAVELQKVKAKRKSDSKKS